MKKTIIIPFVLILISCSTSRKLTNSTKSLGLKGKVKLISEKTIPAKHTESGEVGIDSSLSSQILFFNYFYDRKGFWVEGSYCNEDSMLVLSSKMSYDKDGKYLGAKHFDEEGKHVGNTVIIKNELELLETETVDAETSELLLRTKIEYENGLEARQVIEFVGENRKTDIRYVRDKDGVEMERTIISEFEDQTNHDTLSHRHLTYDNVGNAIKVISCYREQEHGCTITVRRIQYY